MKNKNKKWAAVVLMIAMVLSLVMQVYAISAGDIEAKYTYKVIPITELYQYPEVLEELNDSAVDLITYDIALETEKEQYVNQVNQYLIEAGIAPVTEKEIDAVNRQYNLESSVDDYLRNAVEDNNQVLVQYNENDNRDVANVWMIRYSTTDAGFAMSISNIGTDPIDQISGKVTLYKKNKAKWTTDIGNTSGFTKTNVKNGTFYTWTTSKYYVAEKFEYVYTLKEDGTVWNYSNVGEDDEIRYNFDAGAYTAIEPRGGERHHFVSRSSLSAYGYNTNKAFAIRMTYPDHALTGSWGSSASAKAFRAQEEQYLKDKDYVKLIQMEVNDLKNKKDSYKKQTLGSKYSPEIAACVIHYQELFGVKI